MPRTRKPAGQAVDRRNGRQAEIDASSLRKFTLPRREQSVCSKCRQPEPMWLPETLKAWRALWADPVSSVLRPVDRPVLIRWADAIDRAARALMHADADPVVPGHAGQPVESPYFAIADKAIRVAQACEAQIGVGGLNRARLGMAILQERSSLADLNARLMDGGDKDDDDPR